MKHFWQKEKTDELREGMTVTAWSLVQWRGSLRAHAGSRLRNRRPNTYFLVFIIFSFVALIESVVAVTTFSL